MAIGDFYFAKNDNNYYYDFVSVTKNPYNMNVDVTSILGLNEYNSLKQLKPSNLSIKVKIFPEWFPYSQVKQAYIRPSEATYLTLNVEFWEEDSFFTAHYAGNWEDLTYIVIFRFRLVREGQTIRLYSSPYLLYEQIVVG